MRLPFTVANCDSESKEYPASNLHDPSTPYPWVSAPFPLYAQELTIAVSSRPLSHLTSVKNQPQQQHQLSRPSSCVPLNCICCFYGDCYALSTTLCAQPQTFPDRCLVHHPPSTSMPHSCPSRRKYNRLTSSATCSLPGLSSSRRSAFSPTSSLCPQRFSPAPSPSSPSTQPAL